MSRKHPARQAKPLKPRPVTEAGQLPIGPQHPSVMSVRTHTTMMRSGPLPAPQELAAFEAILPGSAERILAMAEKQQAHRHTMESTDLRAGIDYAKRGQIFALVLSLLLIGVGALFAIHGLIWLAASIFAFAILGLAATFLMSRREDKSAEGAKAVKPPQIPGR